MPAHRDAIKGRAMVLLYEKGYSCAQVGKAFSMSRQAAWKMLQRRGVAFRTRDPLPFVDFGGLKWTIGEDGYYRRTDGDRERLHTFMWRNEFGDIPLGHDIHHKDHDKLHNDLDNLVCLSKSEHTKGHAALRLLQRKG